MITCKSILAFALTAALPLAAQDTGQPALFDNLPGTPRSKVVAYFPQWGLYGGYFVKNVVTSGSAPLMTHLNYAFGGIENNHCASADTWADYQDPLTADETLNGQPDSGNPSDLAGNFHQLQELKKRYPKLKIVMSIGGGGFDPTLFSNAALPANRKAFVKSCIDMYIRGQFAPGLTAPGIFDGFDIDWEFPASDEDRANLTALLAEFRSQLDAIRPGLHLSIASPAGSWAYQYIDLKAVQESLDFFNLMTYDYDGPWNNETGFVSPLYAAPTDPDPTNNADYTVKAYLDAGVLPEKIVFGVPFYGYEWTDVPNSNHGLFEPGTPVGQGSGYNAIVPLEKNFRIYRSFTNYSPWLYDGTTFWTYEDPFSLALKMDYVRRKHLGGVMAWELSSDMPDGVLLKTVAWTLRFIGPGGPR